LAKQNKKKKIDLEKIAAGVRLMLEGMGEDVTREGLQRTPERVAEFYAELTEGMWENAAEHIVPLPGDSHDEMVIVKDISIASVCEHHLAPFVGKCHIAYIPKNGRIVGTRPNRRDFCPSSASSGTIDTANCADSFRRAPTNWRDGGHGSRAYLYDFARRKKAGRENDYVERSRRLSQRRQNAG
jgi:hypothetical protein